MGFVKNKKAGYLVCAICAERARAPLDFKTPMIGFPKVSVSKRTKKSHSKPRSLDMHSNSRIVRQFEKKRKAAAAAVPSILLVNIGNYNFFAYEYCWV